MYVCYHAVDLHHCWYALAISISLPSIYFLPNHGLLYLVKGMVTCLSLWLIGTVRAEPETVISRAWVQSPDPAE